MGEERQRREAFGVRLIVARGAHGAYPANALYPAFALSPASRKLVSP